LDRSLALAAQHAQHAARRVLEASCCLSAQQVVALLLQLLVLLLQALPSARTVPQLLLPLQLDAELVELALLAEQQLVLSALLLHRALVLRE